MGRVVRIRVVKTEVPVLSGPVAVLRAVVRAEIVVLVLGEIVAKAVAVLVAEIAVPVRSSR